jgi:hypothetical protein
LDALTFVGRGLERPECVLANARGELLTADWRGGVAVTPAAGGDATLIAGPAPDGRTLKPNGIALRCDGSFLVTDLGADVGGVFTLDRSGKVEAFVTELDGAPLPPTNYAIEDAAGRVWITVSTRHVPRAAAYRADVADGFVAVCDCTGGNARIVADNLGYTNECSPDPAGEWLYVNETFSRRLARFRIRANGDLGPRETVATFGAGTFPDGLAFDAEGHVWITSIISNRVIRVAPDGSQTLIIEDADAGHVGWVEAAFVAGELGRPHLDSVRSARLRNISSLAFGGPDLRTAYLGCLLGDSLAAFRSPVAGHPPIHWNY